MNDIKSICVFCGSSQGTDPEILHQAQILGEQLARQKISLVYGGSRLGIMGRVAAATLSANGKVVGIIPQFLKSKEVVHTGLDQLITTETMHERKMLMQEHSDGFIALPGGFGTLEELFEIITWAQLGLHHKPIGLLNINGFYDDLINLLKKMQTTGFLKPENFELLLVETSVDALLKKMREYSAHNKRTVKVIKLEQS